jgi:hypothetical protein
MPTDSRPVYIGRTSARMLDAEPPDIVGVLVKAILAWALRDELPQNLPDELRGRWAVIEDESITMHDLRDKRSEAGRRGGEANRKQTEANAKQNEANGSKTEQTPSKQNQKEKEKETEKEIFSEPNPNARETSASASASVFTDLDSLDWFTLPERALVDRALALIGEEGNARMAGRLRKARRILGLPAFREVLATFDSELRAGEVPANKGATLNARLSALEALG